MASPRSPSIFGTMYYMRAYNSFSVGGGQSRGQTAVSKHLDVRAYRTRGKLFPGAQQ